MVPDENEEYQKMKQGNDVEKVAMNLEKQRAVQVLPSKAIQYPSRWTGMVENFASSDFYPYQWMLESLQLGR